MRKSLWYAVAVFAVALALLVTRSPASSLILPTQLESMVLVSALYKCSGTIVHEGVVLTAGHCVSGRDTTVTFSNGESRPFRLITFGLRNPMDCSHDWALLKGDTGHRKYVRLGRAPKRGELIYRVGYPGQRHSQIMKVGRVLSVSDTEIETSEQAIPGESGASFLNTRGEVVGVLDCYSSFFGTAIGGTNKVFRDVLAEVVK